VPCFHGSAVCILSIVFYGRILAEYSLLSSLFCCACDLTLTEQ
jgi:hypothetical protein